MRRIAGVIALAMTACTPSLVNYEGDVHVVAPGETLYTIAWTHGVDYRSLAVWNGLADPDLIYVGQRLRIRPPAAAPAEPRAVRAADTRTRRVSPPRSERPLPPPVTLPPPAWQWPTEGEVVTTFGSPDGIDSGIGIAGRIGQPVVASASGRVVYAGTGLIGYGQLVIIEHNETYLSAYGHTEHVLVKQGDEVERGQPIADMGLGPQRQPRLHFEIRRNGVPVDPLPFLTGRGG
jgi:lipoprotein NlpD